jgi:hypothetical protein
MLQYLLTFVFLVVLSAIAGFIVGLGVLLVQDYPKVGEFLKQRPVLGWTVAFAVGGATFLLLVALFDFTVLLLLSLVR